jgi:tripartite-type tricarboxylate transporter receptor subunit TctC
MRTPMKIATVMSAAAGALALLCSPPSFGQAFPAQKPITLVVPFAPGGGNDILARVIAPRLGPLLNQTVLIENKPGAGGNTGTDQVARSPADGYTVLIASNQVTINPALGQKVPFRIEKDFAPVGLIASVPIVLVTHPGQPFKNLQEFVQYAKANPGKVTYSSPGNGTPQHLAGEVFAKLTNTELLHVPYRGTGPAIADLIGGQVTVSFATMASVIQYIRGDKLRPLGIAGQSKVSGLPDVPTFGEFGLKSYEASLWYSLLAPANTPKPVVSKINAALVQVLKTPEVQEQLTKQGFEPATSTPEQLKTLIDKDLQRWARVISENQIKVEQ